MTEVRIMTDSSPPVSTVVEAKSTSPKIKPSGIQNASRLLLSSWGLPEVVLQKYEEHGITEMFEWQADCLCSGNTLDGGNLVYSAPTSAGKTMVAELLMLKRVIETRKKAIMILPFISVAREKMFYLQTLFQDAGIRVDGYMGGQNPSGGFSAIDIAICTIEKANSLVNRLLEEGKIDTLGMVVVDELHMVGDQHRGFLLELLLTKLRYVVSKTQVKENKTTTASSENTSDKSDSSLIMRNPMQIVGMSATLPNLDLLARWLDANLYHTDFRPVPLTEMVKIGNEMYDKDLKKTRTVDYKLKCVGDDEQIIPLCLETIYDNCSVLIFCPTKSWCEKLADNIAKEFFSFLRKPIKKESGLLPKGCNEWQLKMDQKGLRDVCEQLRRTPVGVDSILGRTIPQGVAYHHAGLTFDERDIVEGAFRQGMLKVLIATSTLSSGVNLPARRVIIRTPTFHGKIIDSLVYKQMVGRAGRKGVDTKGESILVCKANERSKAAHLVTSSLPPVTSCLHRSVEQGAGLSSSMKRAILEVIVSGVASTPLEVSAYAKSTMLAASMVNDENTDSTNALDVNEGQMNAIQLCINFLKESEFIHLRKVLNSKDGCEIDKYMPSQLGAAVLASALSPDEGILVFHELQKARKCFVLENELHIIYLITPIYMEVGTIDWYEYLCIWERLPTDIRRVSELVGVSEAFLAKAVRGKIAMNTEQQIRSFRIHKRFYTCLILHDLVNEATLGQVCSKYKCNRGVLQSLQQQAATFSGMVTIFSRKLGWYNLELLLSQFQSRLTFGVQRELVDLVRISLLNGQRARMMYNGGFQTVANLANADPVNVEQLLRNSAPFMSKKRGEGETEWEMEERKKSRCIWMTGKKGLTEYEAAVMIVEEAKQWLKRDLEEMGVDWQPSDNNISNNTTAASEKENVPLLVPNKSSRRNSLNSSKRNRRSSLISPVRSIPLVGKTTQLGKNENSTSQKPQQPSTGKKKRRSTCLTSGDNSIELSFKNVSILSPPPAFINTGTRSKENPSTAVQGRSFIGSNSKKEKKTEIKFDSKVVEKPQITITKHGNEVESNEMITGDNLDPKCLFNVSGELDLSCSTPKGIVPLKPCLSNRKRKSPSDAVLGENSDSFVVHKSPKLDRNLSSSQRVKSKPEKRFSSGLALQVGNHHISKASTSSSSVKKTDTMCSTNMESTVSGKVKERKASIAHEGTTLFRVDDRDNDAANNVNNISCQSLNFSLSGSLNECIMDTSMEFLVDGNKDGGAAEPSTKEQLDTEYQSGGAEYQEMKDAAPIPEKRSFPPREVEKEKHSRHHSIEWELFHEHIAGLDSSFADLPEIVGDGGGEVDSIGAPGSKMDQGREDNDELEFRDGFNDSFAIDTQTMNMMAHPMSPIITTTTPQQPQCNSKLPFERYERNKHQLESCTRYSFNSFLPPPDDFRDPTQQHGVRPRAEQDLNKSPELYSEQVDQEYEEELTTSPPKLTSKQPSESNKRTQEKDENEKTSGNKNLVCTEVSPNLFSENTSCVEDMLADDAMLNYQTQKEVVETSASPMLSEKKGKMDKFSSKRGVPVLNIASSISGKSKKDLYKENATEDYIQHKRSKLTNLAHVKEMSNPQSRESLKPNLKSASNTAAGYNDRENNLKSASSTAAGYKDRENNLKSASSTAAGYNDRENNLKSASNTAAGYNDRENNFKTASNTAAGFNDRENNLKSASNTAAGYNERENNLKSASNTAAGYNDRENNLKSASNTAAGYNDRENNLKSASNTADGYNDRENNLKSASNTAAGYNDRENNFKTASNTAAGFNDRENNLKSASNTAAGYNDRENNLKSASNTAAGYNDRENNLKSASNTADGYNDRENNLKSASNTAAGYNDRENNLKSASNTAAGYNDRENNLKSASNTAAGYNDRENNLKSASNTAAGYNDREHNLKSASNTAAGYNDRENNLKSASNTAAGFNDIESQDLLPASGYDRENDSNLHHTSGFLSNTSGDNNGDLDVGGYLESDSSFDNQIGGVVVNSDVKIGSDCNKVLRGEAVEISLTEKCVDLNFKNANELFQEKTSPVGTTMCLNLVSSKNTNYRKQTNISDNTRKIESERLIKNSEMRNSIKSSSNVCDNSKMCSNEIKKPTPVENEFNTGGVDDSFTYSMIEQCLDTEMNADEVVCKYGNNNSNFTSEVNVKSSSCSSKQVNLSSKDKVNQNYINTGIPTANLSKSSLNSEMVRSCSSNNPIVKSDRMKKNDKYCNEAIVKSNGTVKQVDEKDRNALTNGQQHSILFSPGTEAFLNDIIDQSQFDSFSSISNKPPQKSSTLKKRKKGIAGSNLLFPGNNSSPIESTSTSNFNRINNCVKVKKLKMPNFTDLDTLRNTTTNKIENKDTSLNSSVNISNNSDLLPPTPPDSSTVASKDDTGVSKAGTPTRLIGGLGKTPTRSQTLMKTKEQEVSPNKNSRKTPKNSTKYSSDEIVKTGRTPRTKKGAMNITKTPLSKVKNSASENISLVSSPGFDTSIPLTNQAFTIIDVCANADLFSMFVAEWKQQKNFSICLACESLPPKPVENGGIGGNFNTGSHQSKRLAKSDSDRGFLLEDVELAIVGLSVCWSNRDAYYIAFTEQTPVCDIDESLMAPEIDKSITVHRRVKEICGVVEQANITVSAFSVKQQYKALCRGCGIVIKSHVDDPKIADWLLDPGAREKNLHRMVHNYLPLEVHLLEGIGGGVGVGSVGMTPENPGSGRVRACVEAVLVNSLTRYFHTELKKHGMYRVYKEIETQTSVILAKMELNGMGFSQQECDGQKDMMQVKLSALENKAYRLAGHDFSLTSASDVAQVLFIELRLPPSGDPLNPGFTKTLGVARRPMRGRANKPQYSTTKDVLEKLKPLHALPGVIIEWRRITNALTKTVFPLQKEKVFNARLKMDRIYGISQTHTSTGRVSMQEPNLQNVPKDFEIEIPKQGIKTTGSNSLSASSLESFSISMRHAFVPFQGAVILAADYSQLELRMIAHLSQDKKLINVLNTGGDVFKTIAAQMKGIEVEAVTSTQRQQAKQVCYGMIYGIGAKALGEQLAVDENEAAVFVETFKSKYTGMRSFLRDTVKNCKEQGYVETILNRRRYLPAIKDTNPHSRGHAERQAVNTTVQGSAADLVKKAMVDIDQQLSKEFPECAMSHRHLLFNQTTREDSTQANLRRSTRTNNNSLVHNTEASNPATVPRGAYFLLQLHDELIYEVNNKDVAKVTQIVRRCMENAMKFSVVMPVKINIGPTWGRLEEI